MTVRILFFIGLLGGLVSCMSIPQAPIQMRIDAAKQLNRDRLQNSLPVRVKIYQLSDPIRFQEATFRELWKSDATALGSSLLLKKELTINPGERRLFKMARHELAEYVAVIGIFRQHNDNQWKAIHHLSGPMGTLMKKLVVTVKNNHVRVQ